MSTVDSISSEHSLINTGCKPLCGQLIFTYRGDSTNNNDDNDNDNLNLNKEDDDPFEVVGTVMNIQQELKSSSSSSSLLSNISNNIQNNNNNNNIQNNNSDYNSVSMSRSPSLSDSISEGYCSAYTTESNNNTKTNELKQNDFNKLYQCVPRTAFHRYSMISSSQHQNNNDLRRFSEPQIFKNLYSKIDQNNNLNYNKKMENINECNHEQPLRRIATIDGGPSDLMYHTTFNDIDINLDCPCSKHHHRRNSVAIRFNKALYKKL
ncbi:similar to Saccharomyces cerevisiae YNR014W Putative protein of unknown function [Maudiozyma saulgeensis]|uniref:Uncharacterized protein n=1 Tax=Maudiozyma saulgeensis TaxID=1789683 RepID=A0A1X7QYS7_9SACH|nr:similar to Saccharomyces cerevisiae YNR014W Putative protein of unknown function [Kazachstania saulgeensis]